MTTRSHIIFAIHSVRLAAAHSLKFLSSIDPSFQPFALVLPHVCGT